MLIRSPLVPRRGLTLTEALVAMFIAALGMISLLTLFPLGALQMGQALKDHRCYELSTQAEALMRTEWLTNSGAGPYKAGLDASGTSGPSNPVFVDPIGLLSGGGGTSFGGRFIRASSQTVTNYGANGHIRLCSLLDDFTFDNTTSAGDLVGRNALASPNPGTVERAGRYNWLAILQRPENSIQTTAYLTILVFDARPIGYFNPTFETAYSTTIGPPITLDPIVTGSSSISISFSGAATSLPVSRGRWIGLWSNSSLGSVRFLSFYRVVGVDDSLANKTYLDLQNPIKGGHEPPLAQLQTGETVTHTILMFSGLAEVFERPALTSR